MGGGWESRSKSADEAASRAERELASPVDTAEGFEVEEVAASVASGFDCDAGAFDDDAAEDLPGRGAMNESWTRS